jgi:hypothetical protein
MSEGLSKRIPVQIQRRCKFQIASSFSSFKYETYASNLRYTIHRYTDAICNIRFGFVAEPELRIGEVWVGVGCWVWVLGIVLYVV